jgi:hypothetical protein
MPSDSAKSTSNTEQHTASKATTTCFNPVTTLLLARRARRFLVSRQSARIIPHNSTKRNMQPQPGTYLVELRPGAAPLEVLLLEALEQHGDGPGGVATQQLQDLLAYIKVMIRWIIKTSVQLRLAIKPQQTSTPMRRMSQQYELLSTERSSSFTLRGSDHIRTRPTEIELTIKRTH